MRNPHTLPMLLNGKLVCYHSLVTTQLQPRWLDEDQQRIWRSFLNGVARINEQLEAELRPFGLDLGEYEILVHLSESSDRTLRMSELAGRVRQSRSRLTHTVARMESKGLVTRMACPSDRRGVNAAMTTHGYQLLVRAAPFHVESVRRALVDPVGPEDFEALGRAMAAVVGVTD
jgi:DNA-binding MarR family transcriptional regulator